MRFEDTGCVKAFQGTKLISDKPLYHDTDVVSDYEETQTSY